MKRPHLLTVVVEDYFQHAAFSNLIQHERWRRFEARVGTNTRRALDLLDEYGIKATFFAVGWIAEKMPDVLREVARRGHEVASKGFYHRALREMSPREFRDDLRRSRVAIEAASGVRCWGYRVAQGSFLPDDLWALDILAEEGFAYDSSFFPQLAAIRKEPWRRYPHIHHHAGRDLWEIPLSSVGPSWLSVPAAGGNYFRQLPHDLMRRVVDHWDQTQTHPFNMYFHVWELDPELPRIDAVDRLTRIRQYRNLDKMQGILRDYFGRYSFTSIASHLGLDPAAAPAAPGVDPMHKPGAGKSRRRAREALAPVAPPVPITIVVPLFNEEEALPYLRNTLDEILQDFLPAYDVRFVFVDDGSTDRTWEVLNGMFGDRPNCAFVQQPANSGVAAAILAGIRAAETDIVCSIDCDCTYDPRQLLVMIPMLADGVDMVTASPYHPQGQVMNVPEWRLALSKGLSFLYRRVLNNRLATYTACFRVYRKSAVELVHVTEGGYLGVVEMLARMDLAGSRILEAPALLEVRMMGQSKMKVLRTIRGHLGLLARMTASRYRGEIS
jgi:polysaccharide deacetylase family protein (PEP-CTERM system associated)